MIWNIIYTQLKSIMIWNIIYNLVIEMFLEKITWVEKSLFDYLIQYSKKKYASAFTVCFLK